ncbi:MAG: 4-(cytidine 5'-diphospho)-2-C-methyl-D-erythritol kinase [Proteobacteria bacterium]|nr:4-(cytidine 5'-diphospho)-2-C-methyl-D-erythritol kinase [Pseudomonadota bacterium]
MNALSLPSPAKVNRFLHITGRRKDGYHLLQTLFQFLDYGDELHFELRDDNQICLYPYAHLGITQAENLIYRTALTLQQAANIQYGINIHWKKRLPIGGGLGGGSSNAATCLFALNWLWQLNWPLSRLRELGVTLGADIPFFLFGHSAFGEGIGEQLSETPLDQPWFLVVIPPCQVATSKMYAHSELTRNTPTLRIGTLIEGGIEQHLSKLTNDFEPVVRKCYPEVDEALKWLSNYGEARLNGSGASVFACFSTEEEAKILAERLPSQFTCFIAKGLNVSPLMQTAMSIGIKYDNWGVAKR